MTHLAHLMSQINACTLCADHLPHGVRPVLQVDEYHKNSRAKLLIAGQAPGRRVHESGVPFDDASGERLRAWLGITTDVFYDASQVAIVPMGFCYPGTGQSGDLPPRLECAKAWRRQLLEQLNNVEMTVVLGQYALDYHWGKGFTSVTAAVADWRNHWPRLVPLPHPSPRNNRWLKNNPWFEQQLVPTLQQQVAKLLKTT